MTIAPVDPRQRSLPVESAPSRYDDLILDDRVHRTLYTSPDVFRDELESIWYRTWVYVGHESEVPEPGDFVTRTIGQQPVLMVRGRDGQLRLLVNRCPHRGNTVCPYQEGNTGVFRCEYHGWTFDTTGKVAGVTFPSGYGSDFSKSEFAMASVPRVAEYRGFVFGSMAAEGVSLEEHLGASRRYIDDFVDLAPGRRLRMNGGTLRTRYLGNWKMAAENSVDGYHAAFLHRSFFAAFKRDDLVINDAYGDGSSLVTVDLGGGHAMVDFSAENRKAGGKSAGYSVAKIGDDAVAAAWADYRASLDESVGAERAERLLANGVSILYVFPNLALNATDIRVIVPVNESETLLLQSPALLDGAPTVVNQARVRIEVTQYGPAGFIGTDDLEVYERSQVALHARTDDWLHLRRGLDREEQDRDGVIRGQASDEIPQRGFWRQYKSLIATAADRDGC